MSAAVATTCPYCGVGCGVRMSPSDNGQQVQGEETHPANFGRLCSKGSALAETLGAEGRLLYPSIGGQRASWEEALDKVARGFSDAIREHGPESVALYVSGQCLTEDYYVANKLIKGFIGTANIDTNSRLCMASAVAGHRRAFGADVVPGCYEDLELADLIVMVGSNMAWCHPVLYQRIVRAKARRPQLKVVVIDPRRTSTCDLADLHLPVRAGSDVLLFNGLLSYLRHNGAVDTAYLEAHTAGSDEAFAEADRSASDPAFVAAACGVHPVSLLRFYEMFARTQRTVTTFSQGVNQSSAGTDKVNAIINCHLVTGRIGQPGMGPFSLTGQPNAMGGREVGGLSNQLAAHLEIDNAAHRGFLQQFWGTPRIAERAGLKAVELFEAVRAGKIKALWIMATNPVVSMPDADAVREALRNCPLVVVSDYVQPTDTSQFAHVLLPATAWGEKDGTVTNSERRVSRQRAFLPPSGEARADWWQICQVARRMGFEEGFDFTSPAEIFDEHAQLSAAAAARFGTAFDLTGLVGLTREQYNGLEPVQWPVRSRGQGSARLFGDGQFQHRDGRARLIATIPRGPVHLPGGEYPLVLNTGRIRDQWHTMTRSGRSARLSGHLPEPYADLHPEDALAAGVQPDSLVRVFTTWGSLVARARTSGEMTRGSVFVPMHWNAQFASDARVGALVNPVVDPVSGEPEFKHTPARVEPFHVDWHAFVLSRAPLPDPDVTWWARARAAHCQRYEIAGRGRPPTVEWVRKLMGATSPQADYLDYSDEEAGTYRAVWLVENRVAAVMFISSRQDHLPSRDWLAGQFARATIADRERMRLLAGFAATGVDAGPVVCACYGVGRNTICDAIRKKGLNTAAQVGAELRAGTNCGSCVAEINRLISAQTAVA